MARRPRAPRTPAAEPYKWANEFVVEHFRSICRLVALGADAGEELRKLDSYWNGLKRIQSDGRRACAVLDRALAIAASGTVSR